MTRGELFRKYSVPEDRYSMRENPYPGYAGNFHIRLHMKDGHITGELTTLFYEHAIPFTGLDQLVLTIDALCRLLGFPKDPDMADGRDTGEFLRMSEYFSRFGRLESYQDGEELDISELPGDVLLRVTYREHRSLQGALRMTEGLQFKPVRFRSAMELMKILDTTARENAGYRFDRTVFLRDMTPRKKTFRTEEDDLKYMGNVPENGIFLYLMNSVRGYYNGKPVRLARRETSRVAQLIEIMALHPDGISKDALMDYFYTTEVLSSRNNSLNTLIYRMRNQLSTLGLPNVFYIENRDGMLRWTKEVPLVCDAVIFQNAVKKAEAARESAEEIQLLEEALDCYYGELLPQLSNESWVIVENEYLRQMYEAAANRLMELYLAEENFQAALKVCVRGGEYFPTGDWDRRRVGLLIALQRYREANQLYKELTRKAVIYDRIPTRGQMKQDFEDLGRAYGLRRDDMDEIMANLADTSDSEKAYRCLIPAFADMCHAMERITRLNRYWGSILCITLVREKPEEYEVEDGGKVMLMLDRILGEVLRTLDIYSRYSRRQFVVLLPREQESETEKEKADIQDAFYRRKESRGYRLEFAEAVIGERKKKES